ncbi:MAG: putative metal-binding motif-containing protein [Deltaproteobacteria bacterium]|nr:putative metal-binding motif-containing protein [Deltaproteobacteria bacterium]
MRTLLPLLLVLSCRETDDEQQKDTEVEDPAADADGDGFSTEEGDCDDNDAAVLPTAAEACDGIDNNCDGAIDEGLSSTWYRDADADGYGDADAGVDACEAPDGHVTDGSDCDDTRPDVYPGAPDTCDGLDNDCDGATDEDGTTTYYADADADGYGSASAPYATCEAPGAGYVSDSSDCDDTRADANPGEVEVCDEIDNDCDGAVDEGVTSTFYEDRDGDGYGTDAATDDACIPLTGYAPLDGDCDDDDPEFHPGADETCADAEDYNCDGSTGYADADGDGHAACEECDDGDAAVNPAATEVCNDIDDDCDGDIDDDDASLDPATAADWYIDADSDGYGSTTSVLSCDAPAGTVADDSDCDDTDIDVNPGSRELCNGIDDDCDGLVDDDDPGVDTATGSTWYADADGDSYGDASASTLACDAPAEHVAGDTDCDDGRSAVNPAATEICNGLDDDCDGATDDDDPSADLATASAWYADDDGDGYGDPRDSVISCDAPAGHVADDTDCDDGLSAVNPAATEICNGLDDDCDGATDDDDPSADLASASAWYADDDGDGYGDPRDSAISCDVPAGHVADDTDCDDGNDTVNPAALEVCNEIDDDCNGYADDDDPGLDTGSASAWYADADADGYGSATSSVLSCDAPSGYLADDSDCDDGDASINPAASETCDNVDEDCDGTIDEGVTSISYSASTYGGSSCNGNYDYSVTISACGCSDVVITGAFYDGSDGSGGQVVGASVSASSGMTLTWDDCSSGCDCDTDSQAATSWSVSKSGATLTVSVSNSITAYDAGNTIYAGYSITSYGTYYDHRSSSSNTFTYSCSF